MKIIHLADIHWRGLSRHDEYSESFSHFFKQARDLNPDIIYVGGDIVHSKTQGISPELIDCLGWWFTELAKIAPTHIILGNHDGLMHNRSRQDAITPIISALNDPNIYLYKKSGVYPTGFPGFNWCVFSCFDEEGWPNVYVDPNKINIALFHGAVWGSKTDVDWEIEGEVTVDLFDDFDFSLLGDIHKRQFLNERKTIAYPGSSIQQNYGEDTGKGFLFWDIKDRDNFDVKFYEIPHNRKFITVDWKKNVYETIEEVKKYPDNSRFRIRSEGLINQAAVKQLSNDIKRIKNATEVVFKTESEFDSSNIETLGENFTKKNLRDAITHKRLMREYYKNTNLKDEDFEGFDELFDSYLPRISRSDDDVILRNSGWQVSNIKFDNTFGYGPGNIINFDNLSGITGIFGKNTKGKSSIMGSLMYGLFNTTDRGTIKNLHIINNRKNRCKVEVELVVNGDHYRTIRETVKHVTRKGEVYASTSLTLYKIDQNGKILEDLSGEQRRETEKTLRSLIGDSDDFLMTSLASQGQMNTFIKQKATSRKMLLTRFLDLAVFDKMHDIAREDSAEIRNQAKRIPDTEWEKTISDLRSEIKNKEKKLIDIDIDISSKRTVLENLTIDLAKSDNPDIVTHREINDQKMKIEYLIKIKKSLSEELSEIKNKITLLVEKLNKIFAVKEKFPIAEIIQKISAQTEIETTLVTLRHEHEIELSRLNAQEKSIKLLDEVPCGDNFPSCKFIKNSHKNRKKVGEQKQIIEKFINLILSAENSLDVLRKESLEEKKQKYDALLEKENEIFFNISRSEIKQVEIENNLTRASQDIQDLSIEYDEMNTKFSDDPDANLSIKMKRKIDTLKIEIQDLDNKKMSLVDSLTRDKVSFTRIEEDKERFEEIKKELSVYDMFMQAMSKKGIPLQIMSSQLPIINDEISKILQGVVGFTVELEADPDSNSMDVYIDYGDSKRIIELASGMEKMMASLSIRAALINVSSLPKSKMIVIDEGFGALDESNIEACCNLLESLKKWFRNIIVISHVDAIKDSVNNSLEITYNEKDAKVVYE